MSRSFINGVTKLQPTIELTWEECNYLDRLAAKSKTSASLVIGELTAKSFREYMAANPLQADPVTEAPGQVEAEPTGPVAVETAAAVQDSTKSLAQVTSITGRQGKKRSRKVA